MSCKGQPIDALELLRKELGEHTTSEGDYVPTSRLHRQDLPERFEPHSKGINALRDFIVRKSGEERRAKRHTCNTDGRVYELTDGATRTFLSDDAALAWYGHNWERVRSCSVLCTICEEAGGHL